MKSDTADRWFLEASDDDLDYNEIENYAIWDCSWRSRLSKNIYIKLARLQKILRSDNDDIDDLFVDVNNDG